MLKHFSLVLISSVVVVIAVSVIIFLRPYKPTINNQQPPAGCYYQQVQCIRAPCDPILVCSTSTPQITPTPTPSFWRDYFDPKLGLFLKYPSNTTIFSPDFYGADRVETGIFITNSNSQPIRIEAFKSPPVNLDIWQSENCCDEHWPEEMLRLIFRKENTVLGGLPGVKYTNKLDTDRARQVDLGNPLVWYLVYNKGWIIRIAGIETRGKDLFNQIISSIRFTNKNVSPTCRPRPKCLDQKPRCLIPETEDMCPLVNK